MRVLSCFQTVFAPKSVVVFLFLQVLYVTAYGELKELRVGVKEDDPTVLRTGATPNEGGGEGGSDQGRLEFDSTGEGRVGGGGDGGSPSPLDSGSPPRGGEEVPTTTSSSPSLSSAAVLYGGDTSTAPSRSSTVPTLTGGHLSHER
jgi:hypothetical protein